MTDKNFTWRGYEEKDPLSRITRKYHMEISEEKFNELWQKFKTWKGSQEDFYFKFVNIHGIKEAKGVKK